MAAVKSMEEQLSGACTTEIAAFDEFKLLGDVASTKDYDHVIFDTAPTGPPFVSSNCPRLGPDSSKPTSAVPPVWVPSQA